MKQTRKNKAIESMLENWKAKVLSPYCLKECENTCCVNVPVRKELIDEYFPILIPDEKDEDFFLTENGILLSNRSKNYYDFHGVCGFYDESSKKCKIRGHPLRSEICNAYPVDELQISLLRSNIMVRYDCDALKKNTEPLKKLQAICDTFELKLFDTCGNLMKDVVRK